MGAPVLRSPPSPTRTGFVTFAGVMVLIAATFNLLDGIVALVNDDYYVADELLFGDFTAWGIWWLFVGALQFATGYAILSRNSWGIVMGIGLAAINALTQLMFLGVYPAWSIAVIVVDGLIIYALTTRVEEFD